MTEDKDELKAERQIVYDYVFDRKPQEKELVIRKGAAPTLLNEVKPDKVELSGNIHAPGNFYAKRKKDHNLQAAHLIVNKIDGTLVLVFDERYGQTNFVINGSLEENPELEDFTINEKKMWQVKDLKDMLKFKRIFFKDKTLHAKIMGSLEQFRSTITKTLADISNNRGEDEQSKLIKLEHTLEANFVLEMPIYKGGDSKSFQVDICVSARSGNVDVWLESTELHELKTTEAEKMIGAELEQFTDIVIIEE